MSLTVCKQFAMNDSATSHLSMTFGLLLCCQFYYCLALISCHAEWRLGERRSSSTPVYPLPVSRWCANCILCPPSRCCFWTSSLSFPFRGPPGSSFRSTWPVNFHRLLVMMVRVFSWLVSSSSCSFQRVRISI